MVKQAFSIRLRFEYWVDCRLYIGIVLAMIAQVYHCIQYRDIWQLFVGVSSVESPIVIVQENELNSFVMGYYVTYFY